MAHVFAKSLPRLALCAVVGLALPGCSSVHLYQDHDQVLSRTLGYDDFEQHVRAGPAAARILPYALLTEQSYNDATYDTEAAAPVTRGCIPDDPASCADAPRYARRAADILRRWTYVWGCGTREQCRVATAGSPAPVGGLGVQVWVNDPAHCTEAVIAFRGTDGGDEGDFVSNLHWLTRALPVYDQYDEVRDHIRDFLSNITGHRCYRAGRTHITAVGHSLGGGLAQLASYADRRIERVYAFDPSMVTGYFSVDRAAREANVQGHRAERIFEHGEILAYIRLLMRQFIPRSGCNPRIVSVRFNVLKGNGIFQHGLTPFINGLMREAKTDAPERGPVVAMPCGAMAAGPG